MREFHWYTDMIFIVGKTCYRTLKLTAKNIGHTRWAKVWICSPSTVIVTSPYMQLWVKTYSIICLVRHLIRTIPCLILHWLFILLWHFLYTLTPCLFRNKMSLPVHVGLESIQGIHKTKNQTNEQTRRLIYYTWAYNQL